MQDINWCDIMPDNPRQLDILAILKSKHFVEKQPVIDAEPVVRCKDCVECEKRKTANQLPILYCKADKKLVHEKGFCSWGERREDEQIH